MNGNGLVRAVVVNGDGARKFWVRAKAADGRVFGRPSPDDSDRCIKCEGVVFQRRADCSAVGFDGHPCASVDPVHPLFGG